MSKPLWRPRGSAVGTCGDIAPVNYNDIPLAGLLPVPLTSVRAPFDQVATTAIDLMLQAETEAEPV